MIDAIVTHPACAPFITSKLADALVGPSLEQGVRDELAAAFATPLELAPPVEGLLEAGVNGAHPRVVEHPVPWLVASARALNMSLLAPGLVRQLGPTGQIPLAPPNVGGFPPASASLAASATAGRHALASLLAEAAQSDNPVYRAATADLESLANELGRPEGFGPPSAEAIAAFRDRTDGATARGRVTLALVSPEVIAT